MKLVVFFLFIMVSMFNTYGEDILKLNSSDKTYIEIVHAKSGHGKIVYKLSISDTRIALGVCRYQDEAGKIIELEWYENYYYGSHHYKLKNLHENFTKEAKKNTIQYSKLDGNRLMVKFWNKDKFVVKEVSLDNSLDVSHELLTEIENITGIKPRRLPLPKDIQKAHRDGKALQEDKTEVVNPFEEKK